MAGRASVAGAALLALLLVGAGWCARGCGVERDRQLLRDSAAQSREASRVGDSLRLADRLASDAERAALSARVASLQSRARTLGVAASSLVDTLIVQAPDTCLPGLQRLQFAWSLHLAADRVADSTVSVTLQQFRQSLTTERAAADAVRAERDTAQARLDRALRMPARPSGFLRGAVIGAGVVALVRLVR